MYFKNVYCRINFVSIALLFLASLVSASAFAQLRVGLDVSSLQEKRSATELSGVSRTLIDANFNVALKKDSALYLTLGFMSITSVESYDDSTYTKLNSTNPYLGLSYHFWSKNPAGLIVGGFYSPYAKLSVRDETGTESWNGKAMVGKIAGTFSLSAKFRFNAGLYYISETFAERASGNVTNESGFGQSYVAPLIGVAVAF